MQLDRAGTGECLQAMFHGRFHGVRVLVTGDTGFKGSWLVSWLQMLGAEVWGIALPPESEEALFVQAGLQGSVNHRDLDIRDRDALRQAFAECDPDIVFHLAAQALVRDSYADPVGTMATNVMGTAHVCEAFQALSGPRAMVVVTSDKCYANKEWVYAYRENDAMGGSDPYSASKGMAELLTASWRKSFFPPDRLEHHGKAVASARAGNVIGPGDWAANRIVPDIVRALRRDLPVEVRNPKAIRPWQHVLEPLSGYLALGAELLSERRAEFTEGWNFGPFPSSNRRVEELVDQFIAAWGAGQWAKSSEANPPAEAKFLRLAIEKAEALLRWQPVWGFAETVRRTSQGYQELLRHAAEPDAVREFMQAEISAYASAAKLTCSHWAQG